MAVRFYFVDVFASRPLTGNPVSLVPDADGLADPVMQAIAREFNQSGTAFLLRPTLPGATWRLRSFTPIGAEVGGAGHHALGACHPVGSGAAAYTRFVNPTVGITEDPATGTAAGPLAARLLAEGATADGDTVIIEQGHALGRPSRIQVTVTGPRVQVSGSGLVVADGTLAI
jgi:predicted PhzF superfamily epimerase YddE/YHI9